MNMHTNVEAGEMATDVDGVRVDEATCIGSGSCARLAPTWFRMDNDRGIAVVTPESENGQRDSRQLDLAERTCPVGAIIIEPE